MAKITVLVCDACGDPVEGAPNIVTSKSKSKSDERRGELCDPCFTANLSWLPVRKKRGRKPHELDLST